MRLLDLFCGRWGWSKAFAARGWECVGVDLMNRCDAEVLMPTNVRYHQRDILTLVKITDLECQFRLFDFVIASPPCENFSTMLNFRPPVPYPEQGIELFNHTRALCEKRGLPYVMENVAGAQRYVGPSVGHAGSFHLWGNAVPPLLPKCSKGMTELAMGLREHKGKLGWDERPNGKRGHTDSAHVATIPPELANCVADYAERLLEQRCTEATKCD